MTCAKAQWIANVVPGEDAATIERQTAALLAELAPDDHPVARILAERVATLTVRLQRSVRHEFAATAERTRLAAHAAHAADASRRAEAVDLALIDATPETLLARKYEAATERALFRTLREIRQWRPPVTAPPTPPTPTPTPPDLDLDSSDPMPAHLVREAEEMRRLLSGLPSAGVGDFIPPLGSIFPASLDLSAIGLGALVADADRAAEPAPRGQSRFADRRLRPRLGR